MIQEPISTEETWLQGIPVSPGIALGKIKIQISGSKEPVAYDISPEEVDAELVRFHRALQTTADQIRTLRERMIQISGEKDASIFDAHILLHDNVCIKFAGQFDELSSRACVNAEFIDDGEFLGDHGI